MRLSVHLFDSFTYSLGIVLCEFVEQFLTIIHLLVTYYRLLLALARLHTVKNVDTMMLWLVVLMLRCHCAAINNRKLGAIRGMEAQKTLRTMAASFTVGDHVICTKAGEHENYRGVVERACGFLARVCGGEKPYIVEWADGTTTGLEAGDIKQATNPRLVKTEKDDGKSGWGVDRIEQFFKGTKETKEFKDQQHKHWTKLQQALKEPHDGRTTSNKGLKFVVVGGGPAGLMAAWQGCFCVCECVCACACACACVCVCECACASECVCVCACECVYVYVAGIEARPASVCYYRVGNAP